MKYVILVVLIAFLAYEGFSLGALIGKKYKQKKLNKNKEVNKDDGCANSSSNT